MLQRLGELIVWNPVFGQVALDYRFAPELCWPRSSQQKGTVDNLAGWIKDSFFMCRRFHDRADLEAQLAQWLTAVNTQTGLASDRGHPRAPTGTRAPPAAPPASPCSRS